MSESWKDEPQYGAIKVYDYDSWIHVLPAKAEDFANELNENGDYPTHGALSWRDLEELIDTDGYGHDEIWFIKRVPVEEVREALAKHRQIKELT